MIIEKLRDVHPELGRIVRVSGAHGLIPSLTAPSDALDRYRRLR